METAMTEESINEFKDLYISPRKVFFHKVESGVLKKRMARSYAFCFIVDGKGTLSINGQKSIAEKGKFYVISPGMILEGETKFDYGISYFLIPFSFVKITKKQRKWVVNDEVISTFPLKGEISISQGKKIGEVCSEIWERRNNKNPLQKWESTFLTQKLWITVIKEIHEKSQYESTTTAIDRALSYIHDQYENKDLTVQLLANLAGLSVSHFSRLFKERTGLSPVEYITKWRVNKAKQLLMYPNNKVKIVARKVGYKDEFYFSRTFKKVTGVSPSVYVKQHRKRIAVVDYGFEDYLISFGIQPVIGLSYRNMVTRQHPLPLLDYKMQGTQWFFDLSNPDPVLKAEPDVIITSHNDERVSFWNKIAPTITLNFPQNPNRTILELGRTLSKEHLVHDLLLKYTNKVKDTKNKLLNAVVNETVMFLRIHSNGYRVYGKRDNQMGILLYQQLGLNLPEKYPEEKWCLDFSMEELFQFNPHHIFLMVNPDDNSKQKFKMLIQSDQWNKLTAVQNHRVYSADDYLFKACGYLGNMWVMDKVCENILGKA